MTTSQDITSPTACMICIGDEILSGSVKDCNIQFLAKNLTACGVHLAEVRIIEDGSDAIVSTLNSLRCKYDHIFTSGGIGPTHDDVTVAAISLCCGKPLVLNKKIKDLMEKPKKAKPDEYALKMAFLPEGSEIISSKDYLFCGFQIANIYSFAGVPKIFQAAVKETLKTLKSHKPILSKSICFTVSEQEIAKTLASLQEINPDIKIGSYPFVKPGSHGTEVVLRGKNKESIDSVAKFLHTKISIIEKTDGKY